MSKPATKRAIVDEHFHDRHVELNGAESLLPSVRHLPKYRLLRRDPDHYHAWVALGKKVDGWSFGSFTSMVKH